MSRTCKLRPPAHRMPGFTLVEMLVVMSLLSLIVLGMGSALRTTAQTGDKIDARLLQADELRVASAFLRATVGRLYLQRLGEPSAVGQAPYFFEGRPDQMVWIGIMPARHGVGGRFYFKLSLGEINGERGLVLTFTPWSADRAAPDWAQAQGRVLLPGATGLALQYASTVTEPQQWTPSWQPPATAPDAVPDRVSITVASPGAGWPVIVLPMRSTPRGLRGMGGEAVFGGGRT